MDAVVCAGLLRKLSSPWTNPVESQREPSSSFYRRNGTANGSGPATLC